MIADIHIHVQPWEQLRPEVAQKLHAPPVRDADALLAHLDREGIQVAGLINYVAPEVMGFDASVNEFVVEFCRHAPQRLLPCGSVNPRHSRAAAAETRRVLDLGVRMLKVHPPHMLFAANAYLDGLDGLRDVYRIAQDRGVPVMIHTGTSFFPGARIKYGNPIDIDDVAVDFPELRILMAHGGRPLWMDTAFYLLRRHPNVLLDLSGIPPGRLLEWFPRISEIADKVFFGSDWPEPTVKGMGANARMIEALPLPDAVRRAILWDNAARLFNL
ncbi:MAG: amidohydrolase family protein [Candidatus Xenobia bacterium]